MGRTLEQKKEIVEELKQSLSESQMVFVINYQGLSVAEITNLRRQLRPTGTDCKVTKNTLMRIAVDGNEAWEPMKDLLSDSSAFMLVREDISGAIKAYQAFQKATKKTELRGGVMEGRALSEAEVKALGDLPSKEVLMAQIAGAINALATKIAVGINEVPASVTEVLQAYADKDKEGGE
uniref:50S ribosomal protein L10 n=1 Tax=Desertifilum tharense IPPAS B-1220 TaxID=1781255 RepID=A0ACD5GVS8_9CYAN